MNELFDKIASFVMFDKVVVVEIEKKIRFRIKLVKNSNKVTIKANRISHPDGTGVTVEGVLEPADFGRMLFELKPFINEAGYVDDIDMGYIVTQLVTRLVSKVSLEDYRRVATSITSVTDLMKMVAPEETDEVETVVVTFADIVFGDTVNIPVLESLGCDKWGIYEVVSKFLSDPALTEVSVDVK